MQFGSKLLENERMFLNGTSSTKEGSLQVVEKNSPSAKKSDKGKKRLNLLTNWILAISHWILAISLLSVLALGIYVAGMSTHTGFKNVGGYVSMTYGNNLMQIYLLDEHGEKIKYADYIKGDKHSFSTLESNSNAGNHLNCVIDNTTNIMYVRDNSGLVKTVKLNEIGG